MESRFSNFQLLKLFENKQKYWPTYQIQFFFSIQTTTVIRDRGRSLIEGPHILMFGFTNREIYEYGPPQLPIFRGPWSFTFVSHF